MAQSMQDFAGLLAALTAAKPTELPKWNDDEPVQDIATLSYDRALRTHARYKSTTETDTAYLRDSGSTQPGISTQSGLRTHLPGGAPTPAREIQAGTFDRKCASVTIRMSKAEWEQLHARATEAGLTISAYLRSCTFEAEALRAQVKQALAEMRNAPPTETGLATAVNDPASIVNEGRLPPGARRGWLRKLIPEFHPARRLVRA